MPRRFLAALPLALALPSCAPAPPPAAESPPPPAATATTPPGAVGSVPPELLQALAPLPELVTEYGQKLQVPGLFVGVVFGPTLATQVGYGYADVEAKTPVDANTIFRVGSITKTFTAEAILKLRDERKVSLDDPAEKYLPELSQVRYPTAQSPRITIRHLLTHTSGLPRDGGFKADRTDRDVTESEVLAPLKDLKLERTPGMEYAYSNYGFSLLGLIVARASNSSYRDYLRTAFFEPLELRSAGFDPVALPSEHLAQSYQRGSGGAFVKDASYGHLGASEADGGLYLSGYDLGHYLGFQLGMYPEGAGGSAILSVGTRREARSPGGILELSGGGGGADGGSGIKMALVNGIGLGWHVARACDAVHVVHHHGFVDHHASDAAFLPEHGVGVVILANSAPTDLSELRGRVIELMLKSGVLPRADAGSGAGPRGTPACGVN